MDFSSDAASVDMPQALADDRVLYIADSASWADRQTRFVVLESPDQGGHRLSGWYVDRWGTKYESCYPCPVEIPRSRLCRLRDGTAAQLQRIHAPTMLRGELHAQSTHGNTVSFEARFDLMRRRIFWCEGLADGDGEPLSNLRDPQHGLPIYHMRFVAGSKEWVRVGLMPREVPIVAANRNVDLAPDGSGLDLIAASPQYVVKGEMLRRAGLTVVAVPETVLALGTESGFAEGSKNWCIVYAARRPGGSLDTLFASPPDSRDAFSPFVIRGEPVPANVTKESRSVVQTAVIPAAASGLAPA
ncbi:MULTISPECIES: hypothetical protein [Cupriavidus]